MAARTQRWWGALAARLGRLAKQLGLPFPGGPGGPGHRVGPYGVVYDVYPSGGPWWDRWRRQGAATNSIVCAAVGWVARTFPEAPLRVWDRTPTGDEVVFDHELERLVEQPNPYYGGPLLWAATLGDYFLRGNAYWLKVRDTRGTVRELWWLPGTYVEPRWDGDDEYLGWYEYRPWGESKRIDPADLVHFRYGLDEENPRKGRSPFAAVLAEVLTDDEATAYTQAILKNLGVPGVILSPDEEQVLTDDELEAMKAKFLERFTGQHRGEPLILTGKTKVDVLSFSPEQLNLRELRKIPEERITAVIGLPAIVAGLGAGLDRSTFANFKEAREAAYESLVIPLQRAMASDVQTQLLPDFVPAAQTGGRSRQRCGFDTSNVRVLQEDQDKLVNRLAVAVASSLMTPNEARSKLGLPPAADDQGDVRLQRSSLKPIPEEEPAAPPPAPPPPPALSAGEDRGGAGVGNSTAPAPAAEEALPGDSLLSDEALKALPANVARWMNGAAVGRR